MVTHVTCRLRNEPRSLDSWGRVYGCVFAIAKTANPLPTRTPLSKILKAHRNAPLVGSTLESAHRFSLLAQEPAEHGGDLSRCVHNPSC